MAVCAEFGGDKGYRKETVEPGDKRRFAADEVLDASSRDDALAFKPEMELFLPAEKPLLPETESTLIRKELPGENGPPPRDDAEQADKGLPLAPPPPPPPPPPLLIPLGESGEGERA